MRGSMPLCFLKNIHAGIIFIGVASRHGYRNGQITTNTDEIFRRFSQYDTGNKFVALAGLWHWIATMGNARIYAHTYMIATRIFPLIMMWIHSLTCTVYKICTRFCCALFGLVCLFVWGYFLSHDDVIKWKHFLRYWPFVRGIHHSPVNSHHKGQRSGALMFSLICAWINGWVNNREAGDLISYRAHYAYCYCLVDL